MVQPGFALASTFAPVARTASTFSSRSALRQLRLGHGVQAGGAATAIAVRDLDHLEARDRAEHARAVRRGSPARAGRDTRRGTRRAVRRPPRRPLEPLLVEERHQVAHGELAALGELSVGLHVGAAAGGVHDHVVGAREGVQVRGAASLRAVPSRPLCACSAPQHRWARGTSTRQPLRASTRIVARFTSRNQRSWTQPLIRATVPRVATPAGGSVTRGSRREPFASAAGRSRAIRRGRNGRAIGWMTAAGHRSFGLGSSTSRPAPRAARARRRPARLDLDARRLHHPAEGRVRRTDVLARATNQAQVHRRANASSIAARPSETARIAAIRPRGDADSSPVRRYVGQCGRHRPHATQASRSAGSGASPGATRDGTFERPREPSALGQLGAEDIGEVGSWAIGSILTRASRRPWL